MNLAAAVRALIAAGATPEMILAVVEADQGERDAALETKRLKDAERQRRHRESRCVTVTNSDTRDPLSKTKGSPTPLLKTQPITSPPSPPKKGAHGSIHFEAFWADYPRKTGKGAARKAYSIALTKTEPDRMLTALASAAAQWNDPKFIPHPATWLNQERWDDDAEPQEQDQWAGWAERQKARLAAYAKGEVPPPDHRPDEPSRRIVGGGLRSLRGELSLRGLIGGLDPEAPNPDRKRAAG